MKKIYFLLIALCLFTSVNAQNIIFPDANFKTNLLYPNQYGLTEFVNGNFQPILRAVAKDVNRNPIKIDQNNDGQIQVAEALNVYYLDVGFNAGIPQQYYGTDAIITNLSGIEYFTNLKSLICDNNQLSSLDLTQNLTLNELDCSVNQINNLVVSHLPLLRSLKCANNQLINLDVTQNSILTGLYCGYNQISVLDIGTLPNLLDLTCNNNQISALNFNPSVQISQLNCSYNNLTALSLPYSQYVIQSFNCSNNQLTNLDVTNLPWISTLNCSNNQLASLNLGYKRSFYSLDCSGNQLVSITASPDNNTNITCRYNRSTALDVSGVTGITVFDCGDSSTLETLFVKNERGLFIMNFLNTPNLQYICANESDVEEIQQKIAQYGYSNCHVNSYCSFTSGGTFYTIQGNNKLDSDNNGTCDVSDFNLPNLKFNITDGTNTGSVVSNTSGDYSIPVQAGTHTLTPVFENPTYFTVSPTNVVVNFPTQASPFTQNFCVSANGVHPDLEVTILPIVGARPGFDASYRIVYKNKGNIAQSGTINLTFNDAVLDFVSSNPVTSTQTANNLSWNFVNLLPFETREILVTLNVNSPMETPAVNGGDVLNYTTTITSAATDDIPSDNTFTLNQTVVNSFDPNDKTCLEGATIPPSKVGDYVHYMIRFENNGTANAQNIVVKDMIDLAKFDINSLVPIKGSHSFVTNITAGNKVEFIFENIDLPFDDANNDGYVAFKIKTKSTLVLGNTFSNTASIYFDYNFPIVTNTATTTIAALSRQDFEFNNYFSLYPNPVSDVLNIASKETIAISSINIYNTLGQLVLVIPNAEEIKKVDVSSLSSGNYFIKINSDKGTSNTKFLKN